jgi:hypothetical protein
MIMFRMLKKRVGCYIYALAAVMMMLGSFVPVANGQSEDKGKNLYASQGKRDPFVPLITPAGYLVNLEPEKNASLHLEGIMYDSKGDSIAILNGELVRAGESIGDAVLASIEATKVTVIQNNQKIEIELRREG